MKLIIDIPEELFEEIKCDEGCGLNELTRAIANGTPFDSVIEEYVERGAITENMRMLDKIDSIKAEIEQGTSHFFYGRGDVAYGLEIALHIIDKHLADMREPKGEKIRCNTCKNNDDELSGECYECIKGIFDHYEPEEIRTEVEHGRTDD